MEPRFYRVVVEGELDDHFNRAFTGMVQKREAGTTVLTGPIQDQAQLQGPLQRIAGLGLTLISANALDESA